MSYRLQEVAGVKHDLADHYTTIQAGGQPAAAVRMLKVYHDLTDLLCDWPLSGRVFETNAKDLQGVRYRGLASPFEAFQVFYRVESERVRAECSLGYINQSLF